MAGVKALLRGGFARFTSIVVQSGCIAVSCRAAFVRFSLAIISLLAVSIGIASPSFAETSVWKVTKGENVVYLGGTIHMLTTGDYPLPAPYEVAFAASQKITFETDISALSNPVFAKLMLQEMVFTDGQNLKEVLRPDVYARLSKHLEGFGVDPSLFDAYRPAGLALTLAMFEYQRRGISEEGVDAHYWSRALKSGKELVYLETIEEQLGFIRSLHTVDGNLMIERTLTESAIFDQMVKKIYDGWKHGDLALLDSAGLKSMRDEFPLIYKIMIKERNEKWLYEIADMFTTKETEFVLVGAAHMAGRDGLVARLQVMGYTVEQLP